MPSQILVSDDSDAELADRTATLCEEFPAITYLRGPRRGLSANRNNALKHLDSSVGVVFFVDDDAVVRPDFLARGLLEFQRQPWKTIVTGAEYVGAELVAPHNCSFWGYQEVAPRNGDDYHSICINATLFPSNLFDVAQFDEALRYGSEEVDICAQAESLGYRIVFIPTLLVDHYRSATNRLEYKTHVEASRLYSIYKRYRWLDQSRSKAYLYALLAPLHFLAGLIKRREFQQLPIALRSIGNAYLYARAEAVKRRSKRLAGKSCR